ncbi:MAG: monovalent cation/H(+) antiporter subunit G [Bacteroidales bacterium]
MKELLISFLVLFGSMFMLIAAIGLMRFRNVYSRLHATTKSTSFGVLMLILGVAFFFFEVWVLVKAALIIVFIYLTAPLAAHSIAKAYKARMEEEKHED